MVLRESYDLERLASVCRDLGQAFATRAPEHDRLGTFPVENFDDLKREGLLGTMVPRDRGGIGADFLSYTKALEQLSMGDASTGLTFNMHNIVMGGLSEIDPNGIGGRRGAALSAFLDWAFNEAVAEQKVFASATSEPGVGAQFTKLQTTYRRVDGGFVLNGVKSFVSMAGHADYYVVAARAEQSSVEVPALSYLVVELDNSGIRFEDVWDVLGMRATSSNTMYLEDCFVPQERLMLGVEGMVFYKIVREPHWLVGGYNGVYLGICTATFEFLTEYLRKKRLPGTGSTYATDPVVQHQVGELLVALEAARSVTYEAARLVTEARGSMEANVAIHRAKYMVGELGPWLASQAIRLCGGSSIARRLPLERYYRDARCGGLMPARSDDCLSYVGKASLGIDMSSPAESYW